MDHIVPSRPHRLSPNAGTVGMSESNRFELGSEPVPFVDEFPEPVSVRSFPAVYYLDEG